ncbi:uncharacterized protein BDV17DRAFT_284747 [Aspergillus undulatus]|uniref:uncharacterized protein n=1 Tax=Aspergillus undulatus TaxID=1810928 RepID=UPI003CCD88AF
MAVNVLPEALSKPNPANMNKRLPPLADRSSLSYRLTNLSKQKLAREATAPDPDIRRCLGHFRMHVLSVEFAQQEMATKITSFEFEDDSESEDEEAQSEQKQGSITTTTTSTSTTPSQPEVEGEVETQETACSTSTTKDSDQTIHVHFEVVNPTPLSEEKDKDAGIVDKGRRCLEKAQKPFWPSPAQCMPVRIAG